MVPLNIINYFFTKQSCLANPGYNSAIAERSEIKTSCRAGFSAADNVLNFMIRIELEEFTEADPYEFTIEVFGEFSVNPETSETSDKDVAAAAMNAAHVLYGAARDRLLTLTSVSPWGAFFLPPRVFSTEEWIVEALDKPDPTKGGSKRTRKKQPDKSS